MVNLEEIQLVVGIDIGISHSAYAYSYKYDKDKIFFNNQWPSGSNSCKEMTAIIFDDNRKFRTFGEQAIVKHGDLTDDEKET